MKRLLFLLGCILAAVFMVVMLMSTLDHLDAFTSKDFFYGLDFLPPLWIGILVPVPIILFFLSGKRKYVAILLFLTCVYIAAFGDFSLSVLAPRSYPMAGSARKITVVALNVQYYSEGVDKVMDGIRSLGADVALLSENDLPDSLFTLAKKKISPMEFYMGHKNSTAILSRYPVVEFNEVELPSHEASLSGSNDIQEVSRQPHRSFVHAVINVDGINVHVISIRFIAGRPKDNTLKENVRWGKYLLATQMQEVDAFTAYIKQLHGPVIFGGDLNAPPLSKPMRKIQCMATDAYMANHIWGAYTFRTDAPKMRLDYLFCMNRVIPDNARRPNLLVSDHFPVVADFWIPSMDTVHTKKESIVSFH